MKHAEVIIWRQLPASLPSNKLDTIKASYQRRQQLFNWLTGRRDWLLIAELASNHQLRHQVPAYDRSDVSVTVIRQILRCDIAALVELGLITQRVVDRPMRSVFKVADATEKKQPKIRKFPALRQI